MHPEGHCCIKAVSHSLAKGGEADVERTAVLGTPVSGVSGACAVHTDHKSVLTVRLAPERST